MPTDALKEFAEYERALATAEAREAKVRHKFDLYDADLSGDIDATEVTSLMDDLGLLRDLKSNVIEFVTTMFTKHDADDDGTERLPDVLLDLPRPFSTRVHETRKDARTSLFHLPDEDDAATWLLVTLPAAP